MATNPAKSQDVQYFWMLILGLGSFLQSGIQDMYMYIDIVHSLNLVNQSEHLWFRNHKHKFAGNFCMETKIFN